MRTNQDRLFEFKQIMELALIASSDENIEQVYNYNIYLIHCNLSEKTINKQETFLLLKLNEKYYNKLKKFAKLACGIDRSLIV